MWVENFLCVNNKHSECEYGADVFCNDLILVFERLYIQTCGHVTLLVPEELESWLLVLKNTLLLLSRFSHVRLCATP